MSKLTVVVCDHIHQKGLDILANDADINLINAADEPKDKLITEIIPLADVAITRSSTDVDQFFLDHAHNVKSINLLFVLVLVLTMLILRVVVKKVLL